MEDIRAVAPRSSGKVEECALCGDPRVAAMGLWLPSSPSVQAKLLVPSDKFRAVGYGLCGKCVRRPDAMTRVEAAILADFAEMAASPERN
jgi:hypothetical protein